MTFAWSWFSAPWAESLTWSLTHFLWLGGLWTALGWLAIHCLRGQSAAVRHTVWLVVLVGMAASPLAVFEWLEHARTANTALPNTDVTATSLSFTQKSHVELPATELAFDSLHRVQPYLLLGWMAGVLLASLRLILGAYWVVHVTRGLTDWPDRWQTVARRLSRELGLNRLPRLGLSTLVAEPMAARLWRPAVILPASWLCDMPAEMIEAVIAHELAHIRRHDLWINLLQRAIETLLFFHPCVWWVSQRIRHERELCCDALAVSATGRAVDYARALEWVATTRLAGAAGPLLATGLGGSRMVLLQRVRQVLGLESTAESGGWSWSATGLSGLAACAVAFMFWYGPVQGSDEPSTASSPSNVQNAKTADVEAVLLEELEALITQRDDDDRRPPGPPRRPNPRDGERGPDGPPRDGDRRPDGPPRGERGPGPREGGPRPDFDPRGDRGPGPGPGARDGDRRPDGGPRDGGPRPPFGPPGDMRGGVPMEAVRDMMQAIHDLQREVQMLRAELNEVRAQRPMPPFMREGGPRPEFRDGPPGPPRGDGDRRRPPDANFGPRAREEGRPRMPADSFVPPRERGEGRPSADNRPGPRPEGREGPPRGEARPQPRGEERRGEERRDDDVRRPGAEREQRPERPDGDRGRREF